MQFTAVTPKQAKAEFAIVGVTTNKDGDRAAPGLSAFGLADHEHAKWLIENKDTALGGLGQCITLPVGTMGLCLVGLGNPEKLTMEKLGTAANKALNAVKAIGIGEAMTTLVADSGMDEKAAARAIVEGCIIGQQKFDQWHGTNGDDDDEPKGVEITKVQLVHDKPVAIRPTVKNAAVMGAATNDARLLANTPANVCTPQWLANEARKRGRKHGFKVSVKGRASLLKQGYGGLCGVGQGSSNEEQLIVMDYNPSGAKKTIVVVGKAVTFDSGGISIKPGNLMWEMKYDKCGGCNVVALMTTLKDLGVKHRVVGIVPAAENMPSGDAQRPGDIITTKKGTTVEVLNTDAEGRLILADAIHHGTTFDPVWMCDMATLTGACDFAVGSTYVAVMSKDDDLAESFVAASKAAGDKAWRLPQGEEFDQANKGTYADLQNISLTNKAGTAIGGSFVGHFAGDVPFAHLDIASKAWTKGVDYFGNGPTGAGMRIVIQRILDE